MELTNKNPHFFAKTVLFVHQRLLEALVGWVLFFSERAHGRYFRGAPEPASGEQAGSTPKSRKVANE